MFKKLLSKLATIYCPLIQYSLYMERHNFLISEKTYSFDKNSLTRDDYANIFQGILLECLKLMNHKNQILIKGFFENVDKHEDLYNDFINIILVNYINNLNRKEQLELGKTGYFNPYLTYEIVDNYGISLSTIAMATIKLRDDGTIKIKYPKGYSTAPLIPLILSINMYKYLTEVSCNFSEQARNEFKIVLEKNKLAPSPEENDEKLETEQKEDNIITKILLKSISIICTIVVFVFVKGCTYTVVSYLKPHKFSQEESQMLEDAGFILGFEFANTSALEDYCSDSGYVPHNYIDKFKKQYNKTILNANNITEKYLTKEQIKKEVVNNIYHSSIDTFENEFNNARSQYGISKKQYCQIFDKEADAILSEKLQMLKQQRPNMYMD